MLDLDSLHLEVGVLADDPGPEVAGDVVPLDPVIVLVVEDRQAGLVIELLVSLNGQAAGVLQNVIRCGIHCSLSHRLRDDEEIVPT